MKLPLCFLFFIVGTVEATEIYNRLLQLEPPDEPPPSPPGGSKPPPAEIKGQPGKWSSNPVRRTNEADFETTALRALLTFTLNSYESFKKKDPMEQVRLRKLFPSIVPVGIPIGWVGGLCHIALIGGMDSDAALTTFSCARRMKENTPEVPHVLQNGQEYPVERVSCNHPNSELRVNSIKYGLGLEPDSNKVAIVKIDRKSSSKKQSIEETMYEGCDE